MRWRRNWNGRADHDHDIVSSSTYLCQRLLQRCPGSCRRGSALYLVRKQPLQTPCRQGSPSVSAGTITGSPSAAGNYSVAIRVTDAEGTAVVRTFDIVVNEALTILTISPLPAARVQEPYGGTFLATGGVPPYTWAIVGGSFPSGLDFDTQTSTISGMLTEPGTSVFTVRVTDSMGAMFEKEFSLPVSLGPPPIIITEAALPQAAVGGTYMARLDAEMGVPPYSWSIVVGALPPGLSLDPASGEIAGMPNRPGEFGMTALVEDVAGETGLKEFSLQVDPPSREPPRLRVDPPRLLTAFVPQSQPRRGALLVSNLGSGSLNFNVSFSTQTGGNWLSVSPSSGAATATQPAFLFVTIDPSGVGPGTYFGEITISAPSSGETIVIPIVMAVSGRQRLLRLSRKGMTFTAVSGGGGTLPQMLGVANSGMGTLNWSISTETASGGPDWLTAAPAMGSTEANSRSLVEVSVRPGDLSPGAYYGLLRIAAQGAASSPRFMVVALSLLPPSFDPGLIVDPIGVLFTGEAGGPPPDAKMIQLTNPSANPVAMRSRRLTVDGGDWFYAFTRSGGDRSWRDGSGRDSTQPRRARARSLSRIYSAHVFRENSHDPVRFDRSGRGKLQRALTPVSKQLCTDYARPRADKQLRRPACFGGLAGRTGGDSPRRLSATHGSRKRDRQLLQRTRTSGAGAFRRRALE